MIENGFIETAWRAFLAQAAHPDTDAEQLAEMRRLFFAGWLASMVAMQDASPADLHVIDLELLMWETEVARWDAGEGKRVGKPS